MGMATQASNGLQRTALRAAAEAKRQADMRGQASIS